MKIRQGKILPATIIVLVVSSLVIKGVGSLGLGKQDHTNIRRMLYRICEFHDQSPYVDDQYEFSFILNKDETACLRQRTSSISTNYEIMIVSKSELKSIQSLSDLIKARIFVNAPDNLPERHVVNADRRSVAGNITEVKSVVPTKCEVNVCPVAEITKINNGDDVFQLEEYDRKSVLLETFKFSND